MFPDCSSALTLSNPREAEGGTVVDIDDRRAAAETVRARTLHRQAAGTGDDTAEHNRARAADREAITGIGDGAAEHEKCSRRVVGHRLGTAQREVHLQDM